MVCSYSYTRYYMPRLEVGQEKLASHKGACLLLALKPVVGLFIYVTNRSCTTHVAYSSAFRPQLTDWWNLL